MSHVSKITAERNQKALLDLAMLPGNDVCADCKAKTPRWASYNLGIFICMTCASIHRKIGTHVTKVKSLTMDSWTKEQVEHMKEMGNIKSNAIYNPNELRHPPPPNMIDSERDSDLEKYIRSKYEYKSFFDRSALVASKLGPSRSVSNRLSTFSAAHSETKAPESLSSQPSARPSSIAVTNPASSSSTTQSIPHVQQSAAAPSNPAVVTARAPFRSVSQPGPAQPSVQPPISQPQVPSNNPTWNDLISLQTPFSNASLPLQYTSGSFNSPSASTSLPVSMQSSALTQPNGTNPYSNLAANPASALPSSFTQMAGISPGGFGRSMSLNSGLSAQAPMPTGLGFGPNLNGGIGASSLQQSNMPFNSTPMMTPTSTTPSPNPFAPQTLPQMQNMGGMGPNPGFGGMNGMSSQLQLQPNFTSQPFQQQQTYQSQMSAMQQPQMFQPQAVQYQAPMNTNPFTHQTQTPQLQTPFSSPQFGSTPSPMMGIQGLPQMQPMQQQQQSQQAFGGANQFTSWVQGPSQNGFNGQQQQQWGGM
ncbi:unnamed protein product [Somion occarium]|uniref:Arf-GAP domain-containing protein n=1 Tax=Somion occarium TaxID=3059160 RepID=A0ABP1DNZ2_9APHY